MSVLVDALTRSSGPGGSRGFAGRVIEAVRNPSPDANASAAPLAPPPFIAVWEEISSTNEAAKEAAGDGASGCAAGSIFIAETQTAGRGRYGRDWVSPPGGLYLSMLVASAPVRTGPSRGGPSSLLPIAAGFAAALAVRRVVGVRPEIRWPNDLDLDGRKVAGVLAETGFLRDRPDLAVVGFGMNLGPVEVPGEVSPPPGWLPEGTSRVRLASALVVAFRETATLLAEHPARLRERWESFSPTVRDCRCEVRLSGRADALGCTAGLAPGGGLRVRLEGGADTVIHAAEAIRIRHGAAFEA